MTCARRSSTPLGRELVGRIILSTDVDLSLSAKQDERMVIAWLLPIPPWDEQTDTWLVKTARWF